MWAVVTFLLETLGDAVLIDFERWKTVTTPGARICGKYTGVMYRVDTAWTADKIDWYQLGVLLYYCQQENKQDYHEMKIEKEKIGKDSPVRLLLEG